jgi:hypothetical protein
MLNFLGIALDIAEKAGNFIFATQAQTRTARTMEKLARERGIDFVLNGKFLSLPALC